MTFSQAIRPLRLREKLLTQGVQSLSDMELLAVFISSGSGKKSCLQLATDLMNYLGDLRAILNADQQAFIQVSGLGLVRYTQLQAVREMCRRSDFISLQKEIQLTNSQQTHVYLKRQLRDKKTKRLLAYFLIISIASSRMRSCSRVQSTQPAFIRALLLSALFN